MAYCTLDNGTAGEGMLALVPPSLGPHYSGRQWKTLQGRHCGDTGGDGAGGGGWQPPPPGVPARIHLAPRPDAAGGGG